MERDSHQMWRVYGKKKYLDWQASVYCVLIGKLIEKYILIFFKDCANYSNEKLLASLNCLNDIMLKNQSERGVKDTVVILVLIVVVVVYINSSLRRLFWVDLQNFAGDFG